MKTPAQWCEDHYPVEADQFICTPDTECLAHAIAKWEGLRTDNLPPNWSYYHWRLKELNGPTQLDINDTYCKPARFVKNTIMLIDDTSCALCQKYHNVDCKNDDGESCPIVHATGTDCEIIYRQSRNDPEPMIALLKSTLEFISNEGDPQ